MQFGDITYAAQGGIANIVINRPQVRNAVRRQTFEELTRAISLAADDPEIGVVVISGAGDKAFCAGGDVGDQKKRYPEVGRTHMRRLLALSTAMRMIDEPIIAKVRGYCVGGGNEIHLFCDLSVASRDKFGQTRPPRRQYSDLGRMPVIGPLRGRAQGARDGPSTPAASIRLSMQPSWKSENRISASTARSARRFRVFGSNTSSLR